MFQPLGWPVSGMIRNDAQGEGWFGAPRHRRLHRGIDLLVEPGDPIYSPVRGTVHRIGLCYTPTAETSDLPTYKLVVIDAGWAYIRLLYVKPLVEPGDKVDTGDIIGTSQNIGKKYSTPKGVCKNHVHLEVAINVLPSSRQDPNVLVGRGKVPQKSVWINPLLVLEKR